MAKKTRVAILISGRGSNMQAIVRACEHPYFPAEVVLILSNKIDAAGLEFAKSKKIKTAFVNHRDYVSREEFDKRMNEEIEKSGAEIICLAGFMRLLSPWFVNRWLDKLINIHPSLLPEFKGANAVGDAIKAGVKVSGCTVHFVREEMDCGPVILQSHVEVEPHDTKDTLATRILKQEHKLYPEALKKVVSGQLGFKLTVKTT
jgi:phosphoribosylglycinamide formyltransferase-1